MSRMRLDRKVVVGFWKEPEVQRRIGAWCRAAVASHDWQGAKFCRFGDNMREVAVTEGNKVAAQIQFGYAVNGYGVGDLVKYVNATTDSQVDAPARRGLRESAFWCFLLVMQADGNGSGAYMHSGMRGGPHVGALRRCSFTETERHSKFIHEHLP